MKDELERQSEAVLTQFLMLLEKLLSEVPTLAVLMALESSFVGLLLSTFSEYEPSTLLQVKEFWGREFKRITEKVEGWSCESKQE